MSSIDRAAALRLALVTGVGGFVLALLSALVASSTSDSTPAIVVRGVLVTLLLVVAVRVLLGGQPGTALVPTALSGLLVGYLLTLGWFNGQVYVARLATDSIPLAVVIDLALWLLVGMGATRLVPTAPAQPQGYV